MHSRAGTVQLRRIPVALAAAASRVVGAAPAGIAAPPERTDLAAALAELERRPH